MNSIFQLNPRIDPEQGNRVLVGADGEITVCGLPVEIEDEIAQLICAALTARTKE